MHTKLNSMALVTAATLLLTALAHGQKGLPIPNPPIESPANACVGVPAGTVVTLTGSATGALPIFYQWQSNGVPIAGATSTNLVVNTAGYTPGNYLYDYLVQNASGSNASSVTNIEITNSGGGTTGGGYITTYFRYDFTLQDLSLYTNLWLQLEAYDGAVVYLNGVEIQRLRMPAGVITPTTLASSVVTGVAAETYYAFNVSRYENLLSTNNVLAVEVHRGDPNGTDLGFDGALIANIAGGSAGASNFPPQAAFSSPANGALLLAGQPIQLSANAIDPLYSVASVAFFGDGQLLGTVNTSPYNLTWNGAPTGVHEISAVVTDTAGVTGTSVVSVQVLTNVPPTINITAPPFGAVYAPGAPVLLSANAQKIGGAIQQVSFYERQHGPRFSYPMVLLGTVAAPPYQVQFNAPSIPGPYLLYAVATDTAGAVTYAVPYHILVVGPPPALLAINYVAPNMIVNWSPATAVLQRAPSVAGPWQSITNVTPPYQFVPSTNALFFRAVSLGFSQLLVLLPGETNAPNTSTGKSGAPNPVSLGASGGAVTCNVLAVDAQWNPVPGINDTINITSSADGAALPGNAPLVNGSAQFTVTFQNTGSWTITASDVTTTSIPPNTSSPVTVGP